MQSVKNDLVSGLSWGGSAECTMRGPRIDRPLSINSDGCK
jgi:hypothetical protein